MVGAGTIINPLLKVVTTVAILAAVYFFIVKPSLETTEKISSGITENSQNIRESVQDSIRESQTGTQAQVDQALNQAQRAIEDAGIKNGSSGTDLLECVQNAAGDVEAMQRCTQ